MSRLPRRNTRTVILAIVAMASLPWAAVTQFDMPMDDFLALLAGALGALVLVIAAAGITVFGFLAVRRLLARRNQSSS
jgi:hypothetical protein